MKNIFKYMLHYFLTNEDNEETNNLTNSSFEEKEEEDNSTKEKILPNAKKNILIKYYFIGGFIATLVLICYPDHAINAATPYIIRLLNQFFNDSPPIHKENSLPIEGGDDSILQLDFSSKTVTNINSPSIGGEDDLYNMSTNQEKNSSLIERGRGRRANKESEEEISLRLNERRGRIVPKLNLSVIDLSSIINESHNSNNREDSPTSPTIPNYPTSSTGETTPTAETTPTSDSTPKAMAQCKKTGSYF
jgi:hypothetical protein